MPTWHPTDLSSPFKRVFKMNFKIRRRRICFNSTQRILRRSFSLQGEVYSTPANPSVTICSIRVTLIQHTCKDLSGRKIIKAGAYQHWIDIYCVVCGGQEMIEETQMQSMEVLSRLISSLCIEPKVDSNSENSFSGEKDFLILVCFRWFLSTIQHSFQRKKPGNLSEYILKNFQTGLLIE